MNLGGVVAITLTLLTSGSAVGAAELVAMTCENESALILTGQRAGLLTFKRSGTTIAFKCDGPLSCVSVERVKYLGTSIHVLGIEPDASGRWKYSLAAVDLGSERGTVYSKPVNCTPRSE